jgi:hypothetical protein
MVMPQQAAKKFPVKMAYAGKENFSIIEDIESNL